MAPKNTTLTLEELSESTIEFFIDHLQQKVALWDVRHADYKNNLKKNDLWKELDNELKEAGHTCKSGYIASRQLYDLIKRRYKREYRKTHYQPSGSEGNVKSKWKFFDALQFLHAYLQDNIQNRNETASRKLIDEYEEEQFVMNEFFTQQQTPTTSNMDESLISPGWRKRKANEQTKKRQLNELVEIVDELKSLKKERLEPPEPTTCAPVLTTINQHYVNIWSARLDALPLDAQASVRALVEENLITEELKLRGFYT